MPAFRKDPESKVLERLAASVGGGTPFPPYRLEPLSRAVALQLAWARGGDAAADATEATPKTFFHGLTFLALLFSMTASTSRSRLSSASAAQTADVRSETIFILMSNKNDHSTFFVGHNRYRIRIDLTRLLVLTKKCGVGSRVHNCLQVFQIMRNSNRNTT